MPELSKSILVMEPGAPLIHEEWVHNSQKAKIYGKDEEKVANNVSAFFRKEFGNAEQGFAQADYIREDTFRTQSIGHAPLEPHAAIGQWDPSGKVTVWSNTQIPFYLRRNLAITLDMDESKIRVIKPYVGGGFGGKLELFAKDFCAAWLAMKTGRPVKIVYTREESLTNTRGRHPATITLKSGVKKDGRYTAQQFHMILDGGAYNSTAPIVVILAGYFSSLPYLIPNLKFDAYHVYTNKQINGALRGHGVPQVKFAAEVQLDKIATELGIDPVDIRLINALKTGVDHPAKMTFKSCGFSETIANCAKLSNWKAIRGHQENKQGDIVRGIGMGCSGMFSGVNNLAQAGAGAIVKIDRDCAVTLLSGAADIGQGAESVLAQIVAEELGVELEDIRVTAGDTELTPHDIGTFASGVTFRAGNAALLAARDAKNKIHKAVAKKLGVAVEDLVAKHRKIYVKDNPEKELSFEKAVWAVQYSGENMPVVGSGYFRIPVKDMTSLRAEGDGDISAAYSFGSQVAEVEVNKRTGEVKIIRVTTSHDAGVPLNPLTVEGQVEGAIACGLGQVLYEDFEWDRTTGQAKAATFMDYKMMTSTDIPEMLLDHVITHDPVGPFGAKECGEGATAFTIPAVVNAIYDAVGIWIHELPVTPEKVLKALEEKGKNEQGGNV